MNCCAMCFHDAQIRTMITASEQIGNCDFCGQKNVNIYPVDRPSDLSDLISEVLSIYEETDDGAPLFQLLISDWNIFDKSLPSTVTLIGSFCSTIFGDDGSSHNVNARIPRNYLEAYGIFSGHSWEEFSTIIKTKNRFYNNFFKADQFVSFLSYSITKYPKGTDFFRARIWDSTQGFDTKAMGPPQDAGRRKPARLNPEGIGVLYLTSDAGTALNEVRASMFDFVSVGTFRLLKDISVVNISGLNNISPVSYSSGLGNL